MRSGETKRSNSRSISVGIDGGDAEAVADGGVGGRAAALAEDAAALARIAHDVVDGEEIGRVVELGDQRELLAERVAHLVGDAVRDNARPRPPRSRSSRCCLRGLARRHRLVGIFVFQLVEREGASARAISTLRRRASWPANSRAISAGGFEMALGIGLEARAGLGDRAFLADAGEHVLQGAAVGGVIEHVVGGDERDARAPAEFDECCDAGAIVAAIRVPCREIESRASAPLMRLLRATAKL